MVYITGAITPLVEGFTITGGDAAGLGGDEASNEAGGGLYLDECEANVADNQVFDNIASSSTPAYGGGIYVNGGGGVMQSNVITGNWAVVFTVGEWTYGGGMVTWDSEVLVQDNLIADNAAASGINARGVGGGVYVWGGTPRFVRNQVLSNTTGSVGTDLGSGGGFAFSGANPWLERNTILDN
ncbi:MAG: right-handed parallel beta-helix repeat-containing protein [Anaerolineae bacterium]